MSDVRLDKYLWAVRVYKTRSDAADAIRNNRVMVNNAYAKPSREVQVGDIITVKKMPVTYRYKVLALVSSRQGAKNVPQYCLNITPQEELDKMERGDDDTVSNGGAALAAYGKLQFSDTQMSKALEKALLCYCELDTLAMVFIWEYFYDMCNKK